jgi:CMP-N-acetylneuraminic acid synthetase
MSVLALIPARGGSKGIPKKNIKYLAGKPLIEWTIGSAQKSVCIDRVVVSTDDPDIKFLASSLGADIPFDRPDDLAQDETPTILTVLHAIERLPGYDWVLVLQPTSPLRSSEDIDGIWNFTLQHNAKSAVSGEGENSLLSLRR